MLNLLVVPDPRLRLKAKPVTEIDGYIKDLAAEMIAKLTELRALGLAAPQFGKSVRLIVLNVDGLTAVLINPVLVKARDMHKVVEQCRSIPGKSYGLQRPKLSKLSGLDLQGRPRSVKGHDLLAQVLAHEVDHLDGVLIDDIGKEV